VCSSDLHGIVATSMPSCLMLLVQSPLLVLLEYLLYHSLESTFQTKMVSGSKPSFRSGVSHSVDAGCCGLRFAVEPQNLKNT
jgi:hypothetical protein